MDKNSTPIELNENIMSAAMKGFSFPTASESSMAFITSFARNFRMFKDADGIAPEILLN